DVTERNQAEEALADSQMKLRTLLELIPVGVSVLDGGRNVLFSNPALSRIARLDPDDLSARAYEKRVYLRADGSELPFEEIPSVQAARRGEPVENVELGIRLESGETGWVSVSATPLPFEDWQLAVVSQDITARMEAAEVLRESEERLRLAQSSAKVGVWDWDIGRDVLSFTPELNGIYGLAPGTIKTYDDWRSLAHPDDIERVEAERDQAMAGHEPFDLEFRILHASGEIRWINAKGSAAYDDSGRPVRVFGVNVDITERKRAEEALRQSEERFKVIATHTPDHILLQDEDLRYTWVLNPQLGLTLGDMIGKTDFDFLPKEDAANLTTIKRRVLETGNAEYVFSPITSREGGTEYFEGSYVPTHDSEGRVGGLVGYFKNVTARVKTEEALRLQANALQAAANGIVITDPDGNIQWVNGAFTRLTGYSGEEATGQNPRVLKSGQHDKPFYDKLWKTILSGRVWQGEIVNKRKDGRLYTEEMTITPVRDDDGKIAHFIAIKQDITDRKRLEAELERTRTEFLGEVSHELKTPLTAIKGCAAMALSAPIPPDAAETRELFDIIDAQANRLTDLVANLLDVTRIEGGRLSIEPTTSNLAEIVEESRVIFEHSQYPHPLEVMLPRQLPMLRADARRVVQVLTNLFTNAAKYSAPTTPIIVTAEESEGQVIVHVRDAGVGIAPEKMPLLFRKFVQVQERGAKGTGLGLFICKGIVEAHGGRIWAESDGKGKGTVFSFTLPAVAGKIAPKHKGVAAGGVGVGRKAAERPFRIVAVDDEPDILHYIEHCLRSANCEVVSTSDPLAAAELVRFHAPDIVLLDMRMPGMSGLDVLEEIRKFCQTPVTFITATQNREDVVRGREFGGTTWLEKPFSPQQLLDHVGLVLARRRRR
ncbi:MAG: PAS domain S-box protein, partial [Dehalococcoidia bacterium]